MKNIKGIFKKEFDKIFKFPRSFFSTLILPGLMIFIIYFAIGQTASKSMKKAEEHESRVTLVNVPESFYEAADTAREKEGFGKIVFTEDDQSELEDLKNGVREGNIEAVVVFDDDFENKVDQNLKPHVYIYFDNTSNNSNQALRKVQEILEIQKANYLLEEEIDPNIFSHTGELVFSAEKTGGTYLGMILPILILSFIFSSAMGIGADAIAGEKERGTLAKLLVLPIPNNHIIIGKILSTTFLTILSALSSFIGVLASLPFMNSLHMVEGGISYGTADVLMLLGILVLLAALASSLLLVASTIAKTIKEASTLAMPIFLAVMILPILTMFSDKPATDRGLYLIPIYNAILIIKDLLSFNMSVINYLLVVGSTMVTIAGLVFLLVRLFKSERVLFAQ